MPISFPTTSFSRRQIVGLIDFYFACTDTLFYDVAICLNAWCFEADHSYNVTKGRALLNAYNSTRAAGRTALPFCARRRHAFSHQAGRLAGGARRRAGAAEGSARIPQTALPPVGEKRRGLRALMTSSA